MSTKVIENSKFIYINYNRQDIRDIVHFKRELQNTSSNLIEKDVVVDLTGFAAISSPEIGAIIRLAESFRGSLRRLHLIPSPQVAKTLQALNLGKIETISLFENKEAFIAEIKKSSESGQQSQESGS